MFLLLLVPFLIDFFHLFILVTVTFFIFIATFIIVIKKLSVVHCGAFSFGSSTSPSTLGR